MAQAPKRRMLDQFGTSPTFISEGSEFVGDLQTPGALVLSGKLRGDGRIAGALSIAAGAEWIGNLQARDAVIAGRVVGHVVIEEKAEIGASAEIRGSLTARTVAIANGAVIEGDVSVTSQQPVVRFDEKRHV